MKTEEERALPAFLADIPHEQYDEDNESEFGYDEYGREYTYEDALSAHYDNIYQAHKEKED
jgi:hypothetical protein